MMNCCRHFDNDRFNLVRYHRLGIFQPRKAADGAELKSPRVVSTRFVKVPATQATDFTLSLMTWGQFITHDVTKASSFTSGFLFRQFSFFFIESILKFIT